MAGRPMVDQALDALAWLVSRGLFRTVDVTGAARIRYDGPRIVVANHSNGLVDAVLLAVIVRGLPRFVAKATLWRSMLLRPLLALAGLVPVSRPEDHGGTVDNAAMFGRALDVLRRGGTIAIFPEGTTHDHLELQRVRTGAARIALAAHDGGVERVAIVPIGLTFDDKLALRSRVLARVGQPIDLDRWVARHAAPSPVGGTVGSASDDHTMARALTEAVRRRLTETTPRYTDVLDRAMLNRAADVRLRTDLERPDEIVSLTSREGLAQAIADAPDTARRDVLDALGTYQVQLDLLRLRDEQLVPRVSATWLLRRALALTAYLVVLGVVMVFGVVVNVTPTLLTALAGRRPAAPVTKGTVRVLTTLLVFPLTWIVLAIIAPVTGFLPTFALVIACPIAGGVAVGGLERAVALVRAWTGWLGLRNARGLLDRIHATRRRVCEAVDIAAAQRLG
ncbi:MAG TPA: 1-acyl-sn-glycerol-3-phosphate acyltransferase [Euzebyales bacterium]|nr:1-acyl-sn-glycerol-3-phosphate acyltransferase [Euzebyales bacterium]